jgi:hypothetical protein
MSLHLAREQSRRVIRWAGLYYVGKVDLQRCNPEPTTEAGTAIFVNLAWPLPMRLQRDVGDRCCQTSTLPSYLPNNMCHFVTQFSVIFATLTVAFKEHASNADEPSVELRQTLSKPLLNINPALPLNVIGSDGQSLGETTSEPRTSVEQEFNPKTSYPDVQANPDSSFQGNRPDPVRLIRPNNPRVSYRSLVRHRIVDVKTRLIALWHQSLVPREKPRGWTLFSYLKKEEKRKSVTHPK